MGSALVVDGHFAVVIDHGTAAKAGDPFQGVDGQPFIGAPLEYEALHTVVARFTLGVLNIARSVGERLPGGRNVMTVLFQQVFPVVQHPRIGKPRHGDQTIIDGVVDHDRLEMARGCVVTQYLAKIEQVIGQQAGPHHVDLHDVDIAGVGGENLLIERQALSRRVGR